MLRYLLTPGLLLCLLIAPSWAQESRQRDLMLRYGARLNDLDDRYDVFRRLREVFTDEQVQAMKSLRISPSQLRELVKVLQENMPAGEFDEAAQKELRKKIQPRFEDIMGSEQFDLLLEIVPSPQQYARFDAIWAEVAATPEGQAAWQAAQELRASLNADQQKFLNAYLNLLRPVEGTAPAAALPATRPTAAPERRLVLMKRTEQNEVFAEVPPSVDYGQHLARRYRVQGSDPNVLIALSNAGGLPVRVLGNFEDDTLRVAGTRIMGPPPLLAVTKDARPWRGRLPARVVSASPPVIELDAGRGQKVTAELVFATGDEQAAFERAGSSFLVEGTLIHDGEKNTMVDLEFAPYQPPQMMMPISFLLQASEEFLKHAATEYLNGNPDKFNFGGAGKMTFQVDDVGVTLLGCSGPQLRLYGQASLDHTGLDVLNGQFEVVAQAELINHKLSFKPVPGSLRLRATYPVFFEAPKSWTDTLETMLGKEYADGAEVAVTEKYREDILKTGIIEAAQLDQLKLHTAPTPDRRTSLIAVTAPSAAPEAPSVDVLRSRIQAPGEVSVAVSEHMITTALRKKIPEMLPILRPVPDSMQPSGGVHLDALEIPELDVSYDQGVFRIHNAVVNIHWSYLLFSGVEPGVRFKGTARPMGSGDPMKLQVQINVEELELLSPRMLEGTPDEIEKTRQDLRKNLQENPMEISVPKGLEITALSPRARLKPTAVEGTPVPSELLIHGRLEP